MCAKARRKVNKPQLDTQFYSDITSAGMLYAMTVRSPESRGIVTSIHLDSIPDGYYLFTAKDVPGSNLVSTDVGKIQIFSEGNIHYKGEPLGIVVGPDPATVQSLVKRVQISIEDITIEELLSSHVIPYKHNIIPLVPPQSKEAMFPRTKESEAEAVPHLSIIPHGIKSENGIGSDLKILDKSFREKLNTLKRKQENDFLNVMLARRKITRGPCFEEDEQGNAPGLKGVFEEAQHVVQGSWSSSLRIISYGEPCGAVCSYSSDLLTVTTGAQWMSFLRELLCKSLGMDSSLIQINRTKQTNSTTNSIWYNAVIACQASIAAFRTKKTVKMMYTREEQDRYIETMLPITITHKTAIDLRGYISAMQVDIDVDAGDSNPFADELLNRLIIASCGCYSAENVCITATAYRSSNPPSSIDARLLDSASFFAVENQMSRICNFCNLTPLEIRKNNLVDAKRCTPFTLSLLKAQQVLDTAIKGSDFNRKYSAYEIEARRRRESTANLTYPVFGLPLRGIGLTCAFDGMGYYGSDITASEQAVEMSYNSDGKVTVFCPPVSSSIEDTWTKLICTSLQVKAQDITISSAYTADTEPKQPDPFCNSIGILTLLLTKCIESIKRKLSKQRAAQKEAAQQEEGKELPSPAQEPSTITVRKKMNLNPGKIWDNKEFSGTPFVGMAFAAMTLELELDPYSFREQLRSINLVISCGKILNIKAAESTIKQGIQKVLSSIVLHDTVRCPQLTISFLQSTEQPRQIGELVYHLLPAAYTQAISQALGCTINTVPLKSDSIYHHLIDKRIHDQAIERARAAEEKAGAQIQAEEEDVEPNEVLPEDEPKQSKEEQ